MESESFRLQGNTADHKIWRPVQNGAKCEVRSDCWGPCQVPKISRIEDEAPISTPRLLCPPNSFYHTYLKHFHSCCMQRNEIVLLLSAFQLYSRHLHLFQHLQNPTCQRLACSFSAVTCPHKHFFQFLSEKTSTFPLFLPAVRSGPWDSRLSCCHWALPLASSFS